MERHLTDLQVKAHTFFNLLIDVNFSCERAACLVSAAFPEMSEEFINWLKD